MTPSGGTCAPNSEPGRSERARKLGGTLLILLFVIAIARGEEIDEQLLQALYLKNFIVYVDWPEKPIPKLLVILADQGTPPLLQTMRDAHIFPLEQTKLCHNLHCAAGADVIFIDRAFSQTHALLQALAGSAVLTISDQPNFIANGGMIGLFRRNQKLRFDVNLAAAKRAGLHISAELLQMASKVIGATKP